MTLRQYDMRFCRESVCWYVNQAAGCTIDKSWFEFSVIDSVPTGSVVHTASYPVSVCECDLTTHIC